MSSRYMRRGITSVLATVLILGTSLPVSAIEEIAEKAKESDNDDLVDVEPTVFKSSMEEVLISFELEENKDQIGLYLRDYETEELLGLIEEFDDIDTEHHEYQWDLTVEDLNREEMKETEDGHYYIEIIVEKNEQEAFYQREEILIHSDGPDIHLDQEEETYHTEDNVIKGHIDTLLSEYEIIEEMPDVTYRLEQQNDIYQDNTVTLDEDGEFQISDALEDGQSTLTIEVTDAAGNQSVEQFEIELSQEEVHDGEDENEAEDVQEKDQAEEHQEETDEAEELLAPQSEDSYQDGDRGEHVVDLKLDLTVLGFGNFPEDPSTGYGSVTEGVVEDFQSHYGLEVTGNADEETLDKIEEVLASPYQDGESGDYVVELKEDLTRLGFGNFPEDPSPSYGSVTEGVVEDFQEAQGLPVSGIADEITLEVMNDILSPPYQDGDRGEHIVELKEDLTALGFGNFPENPSTGYGNVTTGVVEDFQSYYGLDVTGVADEETLDKIEEVLVSPYQDGESGDYVVKLKEDLTRLGFGNFPETPSTSYGPVTEGVVQDFQEHYGLVENGIVDEMTTAKMEEILSSSYQDGERGEYVVKLKENLTTLGFGNFPENPSTGYGSVTEGVVQEFQESHDLPVSGIADEETLDIINDILSPPYQDGDRGEHIVELKEDLTVLGFGNFPENPSTGYGSVTVGVVEDFQSYYGLDVTGDVDDATLEKMEEVLSSSYQDGESGDYVVELKEDLTQLGFGNFPEDPSPSYGSVTEGVVEDFQAYYGLVTNGIADERTLAKIEEILDSPYQDGESGDYVIELKEDLTALGFGNFPSDPSMSYGSVTEEVVKDFQSAYDLPVSGIADEITLERIESLLNGEENVFYTDYNYSVNDMVNIQSHLGPRTDSYNQSIAYVSSDYINRNGDQGTIEGGVNVRFEPNTEVSPIGRLASGDRVTIIGTEQDTNQDADRTWYAIEFNHGDDWQFARNADINSNVDPSHFTLDSSHRDIYQFLVLSETSGVPVNYLDSELSDKGALTDTGEAFDNAANEYSINEFYLLSHALLESGNGSSILSNGSIRVGEISNNQWVSIQPNGTYIAEQNGSSWSIEQVNDFDESQADNIKNVYNMFGIGAVDSSPNVRGSIRAYEEGWFSPEEAIEGGAKFIAESYVHHPTHQQDTLYKMRWNPNNPGTHQYATDIGWAYKQTSIIYRHYQELESLRKTFDIPRYK